MNNTVTGRSSLRVPRQLVDGLATLVIQIQLWIESSAWPDRIRRILIGFCVWPLGAWWIWHDTSLPRPVKYLAWAGAALWLYVLFTGQRAKF